MKLTDIDENTALSTLKPLSYETVLTFSPSASPFRWLEYDEVTGSITGCSEQQLKAKLFQWICVDDELPPNDVEVLVTWPVNFDGSYMVDICKIHFEFGTFCFLDKYGDPNELVTHWMEIPPRLEQDVS